MKKITALAIAFTLALSGCATVKMHPEFNERHASMKKMVMLPPDVQAYEVTFNAGPMPIADLAETMKKHSADSLKQAVEEKGYEVEPLALEQKDLDANPALKEAFFELKKLYEQAIDDMKKGTKKGFTYDVGSSGNYFAERHGANVILYMRETGTRLSSGMTAAKVAEATLSIATVLLTGVAVGGFSQPQYSLTVETAIIDADLGDILWYNLKEARDNFTNPANEKTMKKFVKDTIQPLPDSKFKKPAEKKSEGVKPIKPEQSNFAAKPTPVPVGV